MKALIIVDMQNDFIDGALGTLEAQGIVDSVKEKIEKYKNIKRNNKRINIESIVGIILAIFAYLMRKNQEPLSWAILSAVFGLSFGALCGIADIFVLGGIAPAVRVPVCATSRAPCPPLWKTVCRSTSRKISGRKKPWSSCGSSIRSRSGSCLWVRICFCPLKAGASPTRF